MNYAVYYIIVKYKHVLTALYKLILVMLFISDQIGWNSSSKIWPENEC